MRTDTLSREPAGEGADAAGRRGPSSRFLQWLEEDGDLSEERYAEIRRRLVSYFERRNRPAPVELAEETLRRINDTLENRGAVEAGPAARHCYAVARLVLREDLCRVRRMESGDKSAAAEAPLECRLRELPSERRELLLEYYRDARADAPGHRRRMAERLGITPDALAVIASRIRYSLRLRAKAGPSPRSLGR